MYTLTYISSFYKWEQMYETKKVNTVLLVFLSLCFTHTDAHTSTLECTLKMMATERREHERKRWYRCHHTEERNRKKKHGRVNAGTINRERKEGKKERCQREKKTKQASPDELYIETEAPANFQSSLWWGPPSSSLFLHGYQRSSSIEYISLVARQSYKAARTCKEL